MKKAKIALSAIAILAVVGGAFAFKATKTRQPLYSTNTAGLCIVPTNLFLTTQQQFPGQPISTVTNTIYTTPVQGPCPTTTWYQIN